MPPALVFLFNILLAIWVFFFWFHTNFRIVCSSSVKNASEYLIGIVLNVYIALGSIDILTIFFLPIHEHGMFFHFFVSSSISFISYGFQSTDILPLWLSLFQGILWFLVQL